MTAWERLIVAIAVILALGAGVASCHFADEAHDSCPFMAEKVVCT